MVQVLAGHLTARLSAPPVASYVFIATLCASAPKTLKDSILPLWFSYSFALWAIGYPAEDSEVLLVLSTLGHAGLIVVGKSILPHTSAQQQQWIFVGVALFVVLPLRCNNLYFSPLLSLVRGVIFVAMQTFIPGNTWLLTEYVLFCKGEILAALLVWHLGVEIVVWRTRPETVFLPVTLPGGADDIGTAAKNEPSTAMTALVLDAMGTTEKSDGTSQRNRRE